jgi:hypothetical protein
MAKTRRVVRKAPPSARPLFDEQQWPVWIALVVLGGFMMGVSLAYLPLSGAAWHRTAWPSLIAIPLVVIAASIAFAWIDSHAFRRSLQLSLVLCAIFHVALIVQMVETRMFAGLIPAKVERAKKEIIEQRPRKIIPEYHPTFLVPAEDRPRQDFEKPVETQSPEPTNEAEKIVRQPTDQDRSPQAPQPIPIIEQQRTSEPNVVSRSRPSESAPRLAGRWPERRQPNCSPAARQPSAGRQIPLRRSSRLPYLRLPKPLTRRCRRGKRTIGRRKSRILRRQLRRRLKQKQPRRRARRLPPLSKRMSARRRSCRLSRRN